MKQAIDKYTADMFGVPETKPTYRFYIETEDGICIAWSHLTMREAKVMHKLMDKHNPLQSNVNVTRCGWEEV
jgi:hypothetical protein